MSTGLLKILAEPVGCWLMSIGVLCLALLLLFYRLGSGSLYDWDEAIYAQVAKEMLRSGDWGTSTWNGSLFFHKPPLYFWLTTLTYKLVGVGELTARLWSAIFGFGVVVLTFAFGTRLRSWAVGAAAALLLLVVDHAYYSQWWNFLSLSRVGMMDTPLTFWIMVALFLTWEAERRPWLIALVGLPLGLAVLTKAWPALFAAVIAVVHSGLTSKIRARYMGYWAIAVLLTATVALPWHLWQYSRYGHDFLREYVGLNLIERAFQIVEEHGGSPWFYPDVVRRGFSIWGYVWPLAYLWTIWRAVWRRDRGAVLLLSWITIPLVLLTVAQTKLGWYISMIYPGVALLLAIALADVLTDRVALGGVAMVMLACCIRLPVPANGSPDVKYFAPLVAQYVGPGDTVHVIQPSCGPREPTPTAGMLFNTDTNVRNSLVFYIDRPLTCIEEHTVLAETNLPRAYVITDRRSWARYSHLGHVVSEALLNGPGYILAHWH